MFYISIEINEIEIFLLTMNNRGNYFQNLSVHLSFEKIGKSKRAEKNAIINIRSNIQLANINYGTTTN